MTLCDPRKKCTECDKDDTEDCLLPDAYAADDMDGGCTFLCGRCGDSIAGDYFSSSKRCYICDHVVHGEKIKYSWGDKELPDFGENFKIE